jgi:hypothetical protein
LLARWRFYMCLSRIKPPANRQSPRQTINNP